jgi:hypothetical protein
MVSDGLYSRHDSRNNNARLPCLQEYPYCQKWNQSLWKRSIPLQAEALSLLVTLPLCIRSAGANSHTPLVDIKSCAAFIRRYPSASSLETMDERRDAKRGSNSPIRASLARATDGGAWEASAITLVDRLAARVSNRSLTLHSSCCHSILFHARWCAARRMTH